jgi:hypothetical protein
MITALPVPLPGTKQPAPNPTIDWVGVPLVHIKTDVLASGATIPDVDFNYGSMIVKYTKADGTMLDKPKLEEFIPVKGSFTDAVEAASKLAANSRVWLNVDRRDAAEGTASSAIAVLQAQNGAYYLTGLRAPMNSGYAYATIDTGLNNITVRSVDQLNASVKAVVGGYSWVNFSTDQIDPKLAG